MKAACHSSRKFPLVIIATFTIALGEMLLICILMNPLWDEYSDNQLMYKVHNKNQVSCKL